MQTAVDPISPPTPVRVNRRRPGATRFTPPAWLLDLSAIGLLGLASIAVRLPHLWTVPRLTDETLEVLHSLAILREGARPLTNYDSYYGALYNYLVAAALWIGGESALAPRALVLFGGVLTCVATYFLARDLARSAGVGEPAADRAIRTRLAGLLAALMLATNGIHVVVNSHIAWSNCLTPLFTTAAIWLLVRGSGSAPGAGVRGPSLVLAGLLFGLALQTHPLVITLLPGAALFVLWRVPGVWRTPWLYAAAALFLVGYANVLIYNLQSGWETVVSAQRIRAHYAQDDQASAGYFQTVGAMLLMLARLLGGAVDQREGVAEYLLDPALVLGVPLALLAVIWLARRGQWLPALLCMSFLALLPVANPKFQTLLTSRYLMPIVPVLLAGSAALLVSIIASALSGRSGDIRFPSHATAAALGAGMVAVLLVVAPLASLSRYYERAFERSDTNERIFRLAEEVAAVHRTTGEHVVIDDSMGAELPDTGLTEVRGFEYLLTVHEIPYRAVRVSNTRLQEELGDQSSVLAVLNARDAGEARGRLSVTSLDPRPPAAAGRGSDYRVYRLAPRPGRQPSTASRQLSAVSRQPDVRLTADS